MNEPHTCEKLVWWLGETKGFWIQTGALFLSAVGALWIVRSREKSERRRATVDLIIHQNNDVEFVQAKKEFFKILNSGQGNFARFLSQKESPEYTAIMKVLNTHEFVCGGIREKAYDEKLYKRMQCSALIRDWDALCGFIEEFRNARKGQNTPVDVKTFYQDFEWLAKKWKKNILLPSND